MKSKFASYIALFIVAFLIAFNYSNNEDAADLLKAEIGSTLTDNEPPPADSGNASKNSGGDIKPAVPESTKTSTAPKQSSKSATGDAPVSDLRDISKSQNRQAIEYLFQKGLIKGYEDGAFQPEKEVNRVEAIKMLIILKVLI